MKQNNMKQNPTHKPSIGKMAKISSKNETIKSTSKPFFLDYYMEKYGIWITLGLVSFLIFIIFFDFIVGNKYYLFKDIGSDSINISLPQLTLLSTYIKTEGFPMWSFAQGMGQNIMPSIGDPFSWIVILSGTKNIEYGFIWMEITKLLLTATFFYSFLKQLNLSHVSQIIGSLLYTFSGFMIIGSGWGIFSAEACLLALLLLSFEKLYNQNSWYLFPLAIALIVMIQPFNLYLYGMFLILYFILRILTSENGSWRKFLFLSLKMAGFVFLGVLISSFLLVPTIQLILDSPRVGGNSSYVNKLLSHPAFIPEGSSHNTTAIMRFFSNDLLGNGSNFKGWYNYLEAPMVYIGLLPLLLFPQIFTFVEKKKKIVYGTFVAIFLIPFVLPFFRYAFWLFSGDYYRGFSIFISLTFLLFSLLVINELDKVKKINLPLLIVTLAGLITLLYIPYPNINQLIENDLRSLTLLFLFIYTGIVLFLNYGGNRNLAKAILILFVFIEIGYMNTTSIKERVVLTKRESRQRTGYNDNTIEATAYIKSIDKGFFRVTKDYSSGPAIHTSYNDAKMQDYYGTSSYTSFNQKYYIKFLEETEIIEKEQEFQSRWASGLISRPFLQFFGSVKYIFTKQPKSQFLQLGYDSISQQGDVKILKSKYFLPLGFTYNKYIPINQFQKLSLAQKQFVLLKAFVAEDPILPEFKKFSQFAIQDTSKNYTWDELSLDLKTCKSDTMSMTSFSNNRIAGSIELKEAKLLFFSIPYDKGWHCIIDNKPIKPLLVNIGFMGLNLEPGKHTIEMFYKPPYFTLSLFASIIGIIFYFIILGIKYWVENKRTNLLLKKIKL
jgi:uncharacterized membrane protein YfhO